MTPSCHPGAWGQHPPCVPPPSPERVPLPAELQVSRSTWVSWGLCSRHVSLWTPLGLSGLPGHLLNLAPASLVGSPKNVSSLARQRLTSHFDPSAVSSCLGRLRVHSLCTILFPLSDTLSLPPSLQTLCSDQAPVKEEAFHCRPLPPGHALWQSLSHGNASLLASFSSRAPGKCGSLGRCLALP